ncbi:c-type cytochrome [Microvirga puerhi]|uniref:Cytochrome c n=1 Tax=Microvirga puerhi TaxID=2876078 RepID=A0ABS7VJK0_9HYPH|nr:cytochrome c [Microvirga puerhi]MBZ6075701.1 cytochrome c [Microvirga puerhi]
MKFFCLILPLLLTACDNLDHQPRDDHYKRTSLFADGKVLQSPPPGTVGRDDLALEAALTTRPPLTQALLERGRERYDIYCSVCHDFSGYGQGTVPSRGFPHPPSFHIPRLRAAPPAYFVDVITHGHGVMYSYADRVAPADRWAIAAYIRALQVSQDTSVTALSDEERTKLEAAHDQ